MIHLKHIFKDRIELVKLQKVFEEAPGYFDRVMGRPPSPEEASLRFEALPPGKSFEDKFVFGIFETQNQKSEMIGCADLIRGFPDATTAMLGLLLLSERSQRNGKGRDSYREIERIARTWSGIQKIRIGVVATNEDVLGFWKKMGFSDTGVIKDYRCDQVISEQLVYEKLLTAN